MSISTLMRSCFPAPDWRSRRTIDAEIEAEFAFHIEALTRELEQDGYDSEEAAQLAQQRFGRVSLLKSQCRTLQYGSRTMIIRTCAIITLIGLSAFAFGNTPEPGIDWSRLAPFTAVKWNEQQLPIIRIEGKWYELDSINNVPVSQIISHANQAFPGQAQKRFTEDIVEVMAGLNIDISNTANIAAIDSKTDQLTQFNAITLTRAKRNQVMLFKHGASHGRWAHVAPFSGIEFHDTHIEVRLTDGQWYELLAIDDAGIDEIRNYADRRYGSRAEKRIREDLFEVLSGMDFLEPYSVDLLVADLETQELLLFEKVRMTRENRSIAKDLAENGGDEGTN